MTLLRWFGVFLLCVIALALVAAGALWFARARLAAEVAGAYFRGHGIESSVEIGSLGFAGLSGRIALGPKDAPDFSADRMEVSFDKLSWTPRIVAVRLANPVVRARIGADGSVSLPNLQRWIASLPKGGGNSRFVAGDLPITLSHLRAILATPGGALELVGDVRLKQDSLISAKLDVRPATLSWRGYRLRLASAALALNTQEGIYDGDLRLAGALAGNGFDVDGLAVHFSILNARWDGAALSAPETHLHVSARSLRAAGYRANNADAEISAWSARATRDGGVTADLHVKAGMGLPSRALLEKFPLLTRDPVLGAALAGNLSRLDIETSAKLQHGQNVTHLSLAFPLIATGARQGRLRVTELEIENAPTGLWGRASAALSGGGLPAMTLAARQFRWRDGTFTSDIDLAAAGDYDMLRGARLAASGSVRLKDGRFSFDPANCARVSLAAFRPAASDLARDISGAVCQAADAEMFVADAKGWTFAAMGNGVAMVLPMATGRVDNGAARIAFSGKGDDFGGRIAVTAARLTDLAPSLRFHPLTGTGDIALASGVWRGALTVSGPDQAKLGMVNFSHTMATGSGEARINAPRLQFAPDKLQPVMLSPLLGQVKQARGDARFEGRVAWTRDAITSGGTLGIQKLDFLTPLGTAHAVEADIALTSLLPPVTAPGQHISISRIDWTLPFTGVALDLSFNPEAVRVEALKAGVAEGNASLGAFTVRLAALNRVEGAARLDGIALAPLVTATNLGGKIRLDGKVTGTIPFAVSPEGFRIANGHLASDGPGRISLDRSVWGEAGLTANAVQDLAYQALEYLAYDSLTAEVNSVAAGRLQIVFHIKGRSDPPTPQKAEIALRDIFNGTVLQKPIALPSGTPIDLTLDTSLNFDELLKSYAEAWSKSVGAP